MTPQAASKANDTTLLDHEEVLHLALEAMRSSRHGDALQHLKDAAARWPDNPNVHFLLGAEHAQIGLFERAVEDMTAAVRLDPEFVPARFQLGLLFLTHGRVVEAQSAWKPLDTLDAANPYLHFKQGLESLAHDDFAACRESLARGLALNTSNPALNREMQRIVEEAAALHAASDAAEKSASDAPAPRHVLLSAYTREGSGS